MFLFFTYLCTALWQCCILKCFINEVKDLRCKHLRMWTNSLTISVRVIFTGRRAWTSRWKPSSLLLLPLSMCTSKIFFCRMIFLPPHDLQRSFWLILCPWPWQLTHTVDTCWTIPGNNWCMRTCIPVPWQDMHIWAAPFRLPRPSRRGRS